MRGVQWTDQAAELGNTIERGATPRFVVFGTDGKIAGVFDTVGLADVGLQSSVAAGAYVGGAPCSADAGQGNRVDDAKCGIAFGGCGLAVGEIARPDDPPETPGFATGEACAANDVISVDIDGDKVNESFPLAQILDNVRAPAQEWSAAPNAAGPCTKGAFQLYDLKLDLPGDKQNPRFVVGIDVMGVIDLDGDGRKEIVLALRFPTVRSIVVYAPLESAQRLELVGEATSFPR
jgi:hypothetical protein